jgi:hypothetical protein
MYEVLMANDQYFAAREPNETVNVLLQKANHWFKTLDSNGYLGKLKDMWAAYHGAYYSSVQDGHKISFSGEQGEFVNLPVNHLRNICQNILVMITATRPVMEARAVNTDYKSLVQTRLANGLLDYYMREKRLEKYLKNAVEQAIVLGTGYVKMEWNATGGEIHDYIDPEVDPETGEETNPGYPVYEGDVQFSNLSPFDVVVDSTKEHQDHDWVLCRSYKNRFDLAAKFPELGDKIINVPTKSDQQMYRFSGLGDDKTDDIPVYEFYHRRSESMPDGRYLLFLDYDLVLMDSPMPYDLLPVYRIAPSDIIGTPYGYSPAFDLLPIQDAINSLFSTILSNQNAFGVQNILMPRGADIVPSSLVGGLNLIEYNAQIGKPEPINFTSTPQEVFAFVQQLIKEMEVISGVNSVARGNPDPQLKSGNALALIQSMALQYMSGLQQSYVQMVEDVGTGLIKMLQRFASVPRIAMIVGKNSQSEMKEFTGDDLSSVNRIIVDVGNYLARTTAGRVEMAEQMLQMNVIKTPEEYLQVINTGKIEAMTEDTVSELNMIRRENESLVAGDTPVSVMVTDQHSLHIKEHKSVLADPERRLDPNLVQRTIQHIQEHINQLRTADPQLLAMMGEQSLAPPPAPPGAPGSGGPPPPDAGGAPQGPQPGAEPPSDVMNTPAAGGSPLPAMKLPQPAQPPPVNAPPGMPIPQGLPKH